MNERKMIYLDDAVKALEQAYPNDGQMSCHDAVAVIGTIPVIEERKRGKWIIEKDATGATYGRCSVCGIKQYGGHMNFCYECGADMREEAEE